MCLPRHQEVVTLTSWTNIVIYSKDNFFVNSPFVLFGSGLKAKSQACVWLICINEKQNKDDETIFQLYWSTQKMLDGCHKEVSGVLTGVTCWFIRSTVEISEFLFLQTNNCMSHSIKIIENRFFWPWGVWIQILLICVHNCSLLRHVNAIQELPDILVFDCGGLLDESSWKRKTWVWKRS